MAGVTQLETLDADRIRPPESPGVAIRRRMSGRYPVDPFGLDPQLADLLVPAVSVAVRVTVTGGEHVPVDGPAVVVANRGFGVVEPAALGLAVQRATGRRLRIVGAPAVPVAHGVTRRLGAIASSEPDIMAALHAGHLVGVPLAPTWLRTDAGDVPFGLASALTHNPIIPAAVAPHGRFGAVIGSWHVRFGRYVTLPYDYDPDDPLTAGRFADAMREAVGALLPR
jgi:hypothetical protein